MTRVVWGHTEFGHVFSVRALNVPDRKGRSFRLFDNGDPALGGQWHYTLQNAIERARYLLRGTYIQRIEYLEERVQILEADLHQCRRVQFPEATS